MIFSYMHHGGKMAGAASAENPRGRRGGHRMDADCLMFVGSLNREAPYFQGARGVGVSVFALDEATGDTRLLAEATGIDNPTFLSVSPDGSRIYANSEIFGWREGL